MKRLWSVPIVLSLLTTAAAGCSTSGEPSGGSAAPKAGDKVTLSILSWENETKMKPVVDGFKQKYPNVTFDFQYAPPVKDYIEKLKTLLLTNSGPDLFVMALENRDLIDGGYTLDITNEPFMKGIAENNKKAYSKDGKVYALSQSSWVGGIFYNKDLFTKAGIAGEPKTWQELVDLSGKLKAAGITPILNNTQDAAVNMVTSLFASQTLSQNANFDKEVLEGKKKYADGWTEPIKIWHEGMVKPGFITSDMVGLNGDQVVSEFSAGKTAMILGGPWNIGAIDKQNPNLKYSMIPVPGLKAGSEYYFGAPGIAYAVNSKTKNKDSALKFLDYLSSPEGLKAYYEGTGQIITAKGFEHTVHPSLETAYKGLLSNRTYIPMAEWRKHTEAIRNQYIISLQDLLLNKITPEQAAQSLDKKFKEMEGK
ncbi:ABC transporter substrate-binding protein [Paenibacillus radicis (ex Xue et al. 2023)]|uniref:Extracellular solute-binding protein n=1 Tax=Paenibacillus radicis (ex Xue et al. 2023) TaxID=2972489 RepID=A0ABT1YMA9_9BACL|nr:extracellular solute-binding protein [Paenibacillus radicis (ex Xue et al. 2023)]MCR8634309.1 extracellular solute-binding protein [Paenibacillus radicis (ex Xue et al. 2023)]